MMAVRVEHGSAIREALLYRRYWSATPESFVRCVQAAMRHANEGLLDGPNVLL